MDAFYSIANFTKDRRDKRGIFGDDRLVEGALFAAYVKDLRSWSRVVVKAKHEGGCQDICGIADVASIRVVYLEV